MKGQKIGGRKKGTPNKAQRVTSAVRNNPDVEQELRSLGELADSRIRQILEYRLPCCQCRGEGIILTTSMEKVSYPILESGNRTIYGQTESVCGRCHGDKLEPLTAHLVSRVALEVKEYVHPKLRAISVGRDPDNPHTSEPITITFVRPGSENTSRQPIENPE